MTQDIDFDSIPILDLAQAKADRPQFLSELQHALIHVGFFYIKGHQISADFLAKLTQTAVDFFDLPLDEKLSVDKIHSPTFLGYSTQGNELTKEKKDNREQYDFANELPELWSKGAPEYQRLTGPNLWPDLADFRPTILSFHEQALDLATELTHLVAEALDLPSDALDKYVLPGQQHRAKLIKYPARDQLDPDDGDQGVGAHRDTASLLTILYQATGHPGLQVQNHSGKWIDAPAIDGTFVVNIGTGLEYLVQGVAVATTHRVISPPPGSGPRYSVALFQGARLDRKLFPLEIPQHLLDKKPSAISDSGHQFAQVYAQNPGMYALLNRISSHRDVGIKHYPELAEQHGISAINSPLQ